MSITVIIPTNDSPYSCFIRSILSILINSEKGLIESIIVSINGADSRTNDTINQDVKQKFCEELIKKGYPIKIIRTWSRAGWGEPVEMCMHLVDTKFYLLMHDDVMVLNKNWIKEYYKWLVKNNFDAILHLPIFESKMLTSLDGGRPFHNSSNLVKQKIIFPSLNTAFSIFKTELNLKWKYFLIELDTKLDTMHAKNFFKKYPTSYTLLPGQVPRRKLKNKEEENKKIYDWQGLSIVSICESVNKKELCELFNTPWNEISNEQKKQLAINASENLKNGSRRNRKWRRISIEGKSNKFQYNMGSWAASELLKNNKISYFSKCIHHLEKMSTKGTKQWEADNPDLITRKIIKKIEKSCFKDIYLKYVKPVKKQNKLKIKPLVCVQVYDRYKDIKYWLETWKKSINFESKLLVVQNYDDNYYCNKTKDIIESYNPDFYWKRKNDNKTLYLLELVENKFEIDYEWDVLFNFIDDIRPMRKDFLWPMLLPFENPKVGLVSGCGVRGVALGIRKKVLLEVNNLIQKINIINRPDFAQIFEVNLKDYVEKLGYEYKRANYEYNNIFCWDIDNNIHENFFEKIKANMGDYRTGKFIR